MAVYTTIDNPEDYIIAHNYSGNDTTNNQTSLGMTPDLVWVKSRNTGSPTQHYIVDKVRGDEEYIISNSDAAEATDSNTFALVSGGFNLAGGNGWTNLSGRTYVAWNWKANGAGSANTVGAITSTVSANTTSGLSIVKYPANGSDDQTIGHGLGVVPEVMIVKKTTTDSGYSGVRDWAVYHHSIGNTKGLFLNTTAAEATKTEWWEDTTPTTTVFTIGSDGEVNDNGSNYIAYCFAEKQGYSKFGSYTGNGNADGTFVYTGFRPAFVLQKSTAVQGWQLQDNKREGYNGANDLLQPHDNAAESGVNRIDILSNGFKVITTDAGQNSSGVTYIYIAFAEAPFVNSSGVPCNAR